MKKSSKKHFFIIDKKQGFQLLRFLIKFNLFAIPLYIILISGFQLDLLKDITAGLSFLLLKATGIDAALSGNLISLPTSSFAASIDWDCTGCKSMLAFFALVFATDFPIRKKLYGLLFVPLIYIVNLLRIWFMFFFVANFGLAHYDILHSTIWSWGLIAAILIFWLVWMKFIAKH